MESTAVNLIAASLSNATVNSYNRTLLEYHQFINSLSPDYGSFPSNPGHVVLFIAHLFNKGLSPATITSKLSAISYLHKLHSRQDPCSHFLVVKALAGARKISPSMDQRLPITVANLTSMSSLTWEVTPSPYWAKLLKSMLTLSFYAMLRPGEVTQSVNNIHLHQVKFNQGSIDLTFYKFKHHVGQPVSVTIPPQADETCPVEALRVFLQERGSKPGPLFASPTGVPVTYSKYAEWFKKLLLVANIKGKFLPHSLRIGSASLAASKGISSTLIQQMGRWKSSAYQRYIRIPRITL